MTAPTADRLMAATQATWPAARIRTCGPWTLRDGAGGGRRASAATAQGPVTPADIALAEREMRAMGQAPVFSLTDENETLDAQLVAAGLTERLSVDLWCAPVDVLADRDLPRVAAFAIWEPLAIMVELWDEGGIGAERRAVMARAPDPKAGILMRADDKPAGAGFVACDGDVAMLHALVTRPDRRRRGAAGHALVCAARWARENGAAHLGLAVTSDNVAATSLYSKLGMSRIGGYHYRSRPGTHA